MRLTKGLALGIFLAAFVVTTGGCGDDEQVTPPPPPPVDNPPTIQLNAPTGSQARLPGATLTIEWTATDDNAVTGVDLSYTATGVAETTIAADVTGSSYDWTLPGGPLYGVVIKAVAKDAANQTAEDQTGDIFAVVQFSARGYVTSAACQDCHSTKYDEVFDSGHPYKLNKVSGAPPTYPHSSVPNPPAGFTWDDVTYVIGGYGWKARFIGTDGNIITAGGLNQYNLATQGWVDYHKDEVKPYDCGSCHTTGWQSFDDNGGVNQDGLPGILGTWEEPGIQCEQCHGPGADHVSSQSAADIDIDTTPELCGSCHQRGGLDVNPEASGGFIRHHEQYNEWKVGAHGTGNPAAPTCNTCHEPHIGVLYGNDAMGGVKVECESCHPTQAATINHGFGTAPFPEECETCHMPHAGKSAVAEHSFRGDVATHIFRINPNPLPKDSMFFVDTDTKTRAKATGVTLDFVCYQCHTDPITLEGGGFSQKSLAELSTKAMGIHTP